MNCSFIGTPHLSGFDGVLAVAWKKRFIVFSFINLLVQQFLSDFTEFLTFIIELEKVLLVGDFNLHINDAPNCVATKFLNITESFNFKQHFSGATNMADHTLDFVFFLGLDVNDLSCENPHEQ